MIAQFDTGKWEFLCIADTREAAIALLRKAWRVHCDRSGADPAFFDPDCVWTAQIAPGQVLFEGDPII